MFDRDGTQLAMADFGGRGRPVLFLHGLAGHSEEWTDTASWLSESHHVFALDLRGHGRSERTPTDLTPGALLEDALAALVRIGEPAIVVGQSLGGFISILAAAARPELVRALVVVEASPQAMNEEEGATVAAEVEQKLRAWPVPFRNEQEALGYFGGPSVAATAWVAGLESREDGLWPRFEVDVLMEVLRQNLRVSAWDACRMIECPVLIVRGERGSLSEIEVQRMVEALPAAQSATVAGGHDVHLDDPSGWRGALTRFLDSVTFPR